MEIVKAKEGGYLTQVTTEEDSRVFVSQVFTPNADLWRDATTEEKATWEEQHPVEEMVESGNDGEQ